MAAKIHPWPTRRHPESGRHEVLIAERWVSRQRAWQLLRRMDGRCTECGHESNTGSGWCSRCSIRQLRARGDAWYGPWKYGKRGRPPKPQHAYTKLLPTVKPK